MFDALDFLAQLSQHIPPKRLQLIRRYGLYASRTKGRWEDMPWVADDTGYKPLSESEEEVDIDARKRAWARLLAKVYEVDPFVCPKCGADMKVIAVIEDPEELGRIPTGILSRSAGLTTASVTPFERRVSASR